MLKRIYTIVKRRIKRRLLVALFRKPKLIKASTREQAQPYIDNYGWPTTRCFPRTTADAFKDDEYTQWFFPPERDWRNVVLIGCGVLMWIGIITYFARRWL